MPTFLSQIVRMVGSKYIWGFVTLSLPILKNGLLWVAVCMGYRGGRIQGLIPQRGDFP